MTIPAPVHDQFHGAPGDHWYRHIVGAGHLEPTRDGIRLGLEGTGGEHYSVSQLDDSHGRARENFLWRPPVRLYVRARFSHGPEALRGTAGFGWWNHPFGGDRATTVDIGPNVLWFFFGSEPNNLAATGGWSGHGWFVQGMNVPTLPGWLVKLGLLFMRLPGMKHLGHATAGAAARAAERPLPDLDITRWHDYVIEWGETKARFLVDGTAVLQYDHPPRAALALVLWMDNQWANIGGEGGLLAVPQHQWMELAEVTVEPGVLLD